MSTDNQHDEHGTGHVTVDPHHTTDDAAVANETDEALEVETKH